MRKAFHWVRANLFGSPLDAALTLIAAWAVVALIAKGLLPALALDWTVIGVNLKLMMTGSYPTEELWRIWLAALYAAFAGGVSFGLASGRPRALGLILAGLGLLLLSPLGSTPKAWVVAAIALTVGGFILARALGKYRGRKAAAALVAGLWLAYLPVAFFLARGCTGLEGLLPVVETNHWGGLLLTLMVALTSIALSFPLGLALALGRRSTLPLVKAASVFFIETVRGVPLITILFIAYLIVPLALPPALNPSVFIRAMIGVVAFHAAYMAENFRGGLQGIPRTQYEAAASLGLGKGKTMLLVVLPQVLKRMIPVLVGSFTGALKDTSLVSIIGLLDMIGISSAIASNPEYMDASPQVLLFMAAIYFALCYGISGASGALERRLSAGSNTVGGR